MHKSITYKVNIVIVGLEKKLLYNLLKLRITTLLNVIKNRRIRTFV